MRARITFAGDMLCSPGVTEKTEKIYGARDYTYAFEKIKDDLSRGDYLIGNLETPVAGEDMLFTHERYCFNTPDEFASMLKGYGFGMVCLANNHCMDRGEKGIVRTLDALDRIGLEHTGLYRDAGERKPTVIDVNGIRIGIVNYTYGTNAFAHHIFLSERPSPMVNLFQPEETLPGSIHLLESDGYIAEKTAEYYGGGSAVYDEYIRPYLERLENDIKETKAASDILIAVMHSGGQYNPLPDAYTRRVAKTLRRYGADCIVGHHPHVIHPSWIDGGIFNAFSLGNLFCDPSDAHDPVGASYSVLLTLDIVKDGGGCRLDGAGFSVTKTMLDDYGLPYCVNAADVSGDANAHKYVALFAGNFRFRGEADIIRENERYFTLFEGGLL